MKLKVFIAIALFLCLTFVYGYIWVLVDIVKEHQYNAESLKKDLFISALMSLISTSGFYLKIWLAKKNKM